VVTFAVALSLPFSGRLFYFHPTTTIIFFDNEEEKQKKDREKGYAFQAAS
jgi:hypothetical protein